MPVFRRLWRLPSLLAMLLVGLAIALLYFPFTNRDGHRVLISRWSGILIRICGIRVKVSNADGAPDLAAPDTSRGFLMLVNHVSWLDIFVINQLAASRFVAKSEIASWPAIGTLVGRVGTIFIERGRRRAVHGVLNQVTEHLTAEELVSIFPEGTTTPGRDLLPFHGNLVQAAINAGQPVLPVGLKYCDPNGLISEVPTFVGETTFMDSVWRICGHSSLETELHVLAPIATDRGDTRHQIAAAARHQISRQLGLGLASKLPGTGSGH